MPTRTPRVSTALVLAGVASAGFLVPHHAGHAQPGTAAGQPLPSRLVRAADAVPTRGEWGGWLRYVRGDTHGTRDMVVLAVTLKPGREPHPPHRHAEEEFMILAEGTGTWHIDGKEFPARIGDLVYAAPWAMHGIKNTGDGPLTYYMVKWNNKGMPAPERPDPKGAGAKPKNDWSPIAGAWKAEDGHLAISSLYQPSHGTRQRDGTVYFKPAGDRLTGYSSTNEFKDGRTDFHSVQFAGGRLVFEFDVDFRAGLNRERAGRGTIRVEARLRDDRLTGKWGLFDMTGEELFRGVWDAVRAKDEGKK